jgi:hypothetical protein
VTGQGEIHNEGFKNVCFSQIFSEDDETKECEMGGSCSMYGSNIGKCIQIWNQKT